MAISGLRYAQDDFDGDMKSVTYPTIDVTLGGGFATWTTAIAALKTALALWAIGREHIGYIPVIDCLHFIITLYREKCMDRYQEQPKL